MRKIIWIPVTVLTLALTGCSTFSRHPTFNPSNNETASTTERAVDTPPAAPKATWSDRQASLDRIQSWWVNGKIGVQTARNSGSASVNWTQRHSAYTISLLGPLGSHGMRLAGRPGRVTLQTSDGRAFTARSPEQLLAAQWGFNLPISNMNYWVRGLPVPGLAARTQFDHYGRLTSLTQSGWHITYLGYTNVGGTDLPRSMAITSSSLRAKIIIYQWKVS